MVDIFLSLILLFGLVIAMGFCLIVEALIIAYGKHKVAIAAVRARVQFALISRIFAGLRYFDHGRIGLMYAAARFLLTVVDAQRRKRQLFYQAVYRHALNRVLRG